MQSMTMFFVRSFRILWVFTVVYLCVFWLANALRTTTNCSTKLQVCHVRMEIYYMKVPSMKDHLPKDPPIVEEPSKDSKASVPKGILYAAKR